MSHNAACDNDSSHNVACGNDMSHNAARDNDMNHNTRDVAAIMQLVTMT